MKNSLLTQFGDRRPVTQAQFAFDYSNKYPSDFVSTSNPSLLNWDNPEKCALILSSTKACNTNKKYTCYGNLRAPIKAINRPSMNLQCVSNNAYEGLQFPKGNEISSEDLFISTTTGKTKRIFPMEMKLGLVDVNKTDNSWQKLPRNVVTAESGRMFKQYPKSILPEIGKKNYYMNNPYAGIKDSVVVNKGQKLLKHSIESRGCTAQVKQRGKTSNKQKPQRVSTAQVDGERRPESRYNKKSLYAKLDYGRASSPEYKVPIVEMNFSEFANQEVVPDCWK